MQIKSGQVYKHLVLGAKVLGFFPVVIIICGLLEVPMIYSHFLYYWLIAWLIGEMGYFQMSINGLLEKKLEKVNLTHQILMGIGYIIEIALVIGFIVFILQGVMYFKIFIGVFYLFMYILGIASYSANYYNMLTLENMCFITAFYALSFQICHLECLGPSYILIVSINIFMNNQRNIDSLLAQTKANTPMAGNIKKENVKWLWILISFVLIGYPFRKHISKVVTALLKRVFKIIVQIIIIIVEWLTRWFTLPPEERSEIEKKEVLQATTSDNYNSFIDELMMCIICIIVIFIILKNRKAILAGIREMIQQIKKLLGRIYKMLFGVRKKIEHENECYWEVEEIIESSIVAHNKIEHIAKRKWLRSVRNYLRQLSPDASYREGYKLLLQGAKLRGLTIEYSKTPREILVDIENQMSLYNMEQGTSIYENIRYGEKQTDINELTIIAHILEELRIQVKG